MDPDFQNFSAQIAAASAAVDAARRSSNFTTRLSPQHYQTLAELVYRHSRIHLGGEKQTLVATRLAKRLRELGLEDFGEYVRLLQSADGARETGILIDFISTNYTHFFRERDHFQLLNNTIVPNWRASRTTDAFRVWSAACSSGEEPYSIALCLAESFAGTPEIPWTVDASDISSRMLNRAEEGIYPADQLKLPDATWLPRYFQKGTGAYNGFCRVKDNLRNRVRFHHLNLFADRYPVAPGFQVIFCRNVMIYFDQATQAELIARLSGYLAPGGHLLIGHSESLLNVKHGLKSVQPSVYRKDPQASDANPNAPTSTRKASP